MTAEEEIIFTIQNACGVLGGTKLDVERHKEYAQSLMRELATRLPEKNEGTDNAIAEQVMNELVKASGAPERKIMSHSGYAKLFAPKFAAILRAELTKLNA